MRGCLALVWVATCSFVTACYGQPERLCDEVFIAWGFDDHELGTSDDVSGAPGLQVDVVVLSELPEGTEGNLIVTDESGTERPHGQPASFDADGRMVFSAVEVPVGLVLFTLRTSDACRAIESNRTRFVVDELGVPVCEMTFNPDPRSIEGPPPRAYIAADDLDGALPQLQAEIGVFTARSQMEITLLTLNRDTLSLTSLALTSSDAGMAVFGVTMGEGEQAIRALCANGPGDVTLSTATFELLVDTTSPTCQILAPASRVTAPDDIDGNPANGVQILVVGQTPDADTIGSASQFGINGDLQNGSLVAATGQTTSVLTVPVGGGAAQDFSLELRDRAGNLCTATATF